MKYLTKEWFAEQHLAWALLEKKVSKYAERFDEKYFQKRYRESFERYRNNERNADWYRSPQEDLMQLEEFIAQPNLSDEERARRIKFKEDYLYLHHKRLEKGTFFPFDEELCKRRFDNDFAYVIALYKQLPPDLLSEIADIRLCALGYTSAELKKSLKRYGLQLEKSCEIRLKKANEETKSAEKSLKKQLNVDEYGDYMFLMGCEKRGNDIFLEFDGGDGLLIKEGRVLEGENHRILRYDPDVPYSEWSRIAAAELHQEEGGFQLHLLLSDCDEQNVRDDWYFTVCGTDIEEIEG